MDGEMADTVGQRIRRARKARNMSQMELAKRVGTVYQRVSGWERGEVAPGMASLKRLAEALGVSLDWLIAGKGPMFGPGSEPREFKPLLIPVYGSVPGGPPYDPGDPGVIDTMAVSPDYASREVFGLVVKGDSMAPTLRDGDKILVAKDIQARSGNVVVVRVNHGEYTVKRLRVEKGVVILMPDNSSFQPIVLGPEDEPEIVGVVIEVHRKVQ